MIDTALWMPVKWLGGELSALLLGLAAHHDDIVDPDFLAWLKARLDHIITLDPWVLVIILTVIVLAIPAGIVGFYIYQQWRLKYS
ncbi:MAG: hypothetical protein OXR67_10505 [Chloroflexota bacterium]|nr:hypothetical protein [Chloroflexota bacterium]